MPWPILCSTMTYSPYAFWCQGKRGFPSATLQVRILLLSLGPPVELKAKISSHKLILHPVPAYFIHVLYNSTASPPKLHSCCIPHSPQFLNHKIVLTFWCRARKAQRLQKSWENLIHNLIQVVSKKLKRELCLGTSKELIATQQRWPDLLLVTADPNSK